MAQGLVLITDTKLLISHPVPPDEKHARLTIAWKGRGGEMNIKFLKVGIFILEENQINLILHKQEY